MATKRDKTFGYKFDIFEEKQATDEAEKRFTTSMNNFGYKKVSKGWITKTEYGYGLIRFGKAKKLSYIDEKKLVILDLTLRSYDKVTEFILIKMPKIKVLIENKIKERYDS